MGIAAAVHSEQGSVEKCTTRLSTVVLFVARIGFDVTPSDCLKRI
jgi:hypothetical protein